MGLGRLSHGRGLEGLGLPLVQSTKILGIFFSNDKDTQDELNFKPIIEKTKKLLNAWKGRNLSIFGRVIAVKSHAIAILQYAASNIRIPPELIKDMNKIIYGFVWRGPDKITRISGAQETGQGGINLPMVEDIVMGAQLQWLRRMDSWNDRKWTVFYKKRSRQNWWPRCTKWRNAQKG